MTAKLADIKKMDFQTAIDELESIVNKFESGQIKLEQAIEYYSRGAQLQKHCKEKLSEAKLKVQKITTQKDGTTKTALFSESQED